MLNFKYCFIITIITSQYLCMHVLSQGGICLSKGIKLCAHVPRYRSQFRFEYLLFRAWLFNKMPTIFCLYSLNCCNWVFKLSENNNYNYICFIFALELNSFPRGNNVLFSWAGSSEMQQILGKNCEHQRWAVWTFRCGHWASACFYLDLCIGTWRLKGFMAEQQLIWTKCCLKHSLPAPVFHPSRMWFSCLWLED